MRGPSQFDVTFPIYIYRGNKEADYGVHRRMELPSGGNCHTYVMADLDLDGYVDLVITTCFGLRIFSGGPDGPRPDRYVDLRFAEDDLHIMQVLVADFNRDGYLDLLAMVGTYDDKPESMANSSFICYGSAQGFSVDRSENLPTYCAGEGHIADVNRDGYLDIITSDKRGCLIIFLGGPEGYSRERTQKIPIDENWIGAINAADWTKNGWLDLIVAVQSHYYRKNTTFYVFYGGPGGYTPENSVCYAGGYTPGSIAVADLDHDGNLELLVPAYSTNLTRKLPARIFRAKGKDIDFDNPLNLPTNAAHAFIAFDLNGNGYLDVMAACHRNNLGHQGRLADLLERTRRNLAKSNYPSPRPRPSFFHYSRPGQQLHTPTNRELFFSNLRYEGTKTHQNSLAS